MQNRLPAMARPQTHGFTLIEAVILIAIIGLVAVVAAPRFISVSEMDSARAHRQALSDLRFAHQLSTSSGCPVQVDFGVDRYEMTQRTACRSGAFALPVVDPATNETPFLIVTPPGVVLSSTIDPLIFDALGRTTNSAGAVSNAVVSIGTRSLEAIGETGLVRTP